MTMRLLSLLAALILAPLLAATQAEAQASRTWVSGVGDDVNPCSRTAPCKTFAGAISKTAAGGEISVLDPGGFGSVTIVKSISIVADGAEGGILAASANGIIVNAPPPAVVSIRGLVIEGAGTGLNGIRVVQAGSVYVSDTVIRGFKDAATGRGVSVESAVSATRVFLKNVEINNNNIGVYVHGGANFNLVYIDRCTIEANSSRPLLLDTNKSIAHVSGSRLLGTAISMINGAQVGSTGDNYIAGAFTPSVVEPLQ